MKDQLNNTKTSLEEQQSIAEGLRGQVEEANEEISKLLADLKAKNEEASGLDRSLNRLKTEWDEFRVQVEKALDQLVKEVAKDDDGTTSKVNLLAFPDVNMSMHQVEAIKKRNAIIASYR